MILTPEIVRSLFLDVICAGSQKKQTAHFLKPLALEVLGSITEAVTEQGERSESNRSRQLACARAFLSCEIRFDARTKTSTVSDLLGLMYSVKEGKGKGLTLFCNEYLTYLETELLTRCAEMDEKDSSAQATGYVELLYSAAKIMLRLESESEVDAAILKQYKETVIRRILGFFMAAAFFNCSGVGDLQKGTGKRKKGKKGSTSATHPMVEMVSKLKDCSKEGNAVSYSTRSIISSRFFSLVSDYVHHSMHQSDEDQQVKAEKDGRTLSVLTELCNDWKFLESSGAERFVSASNSDEDDGESVEPALIIEQLRTHVTDLTNSLEKDPENSIV
jgi:hypothetical protein